MSGGGGGQEALQTGPTYAAANAAGQAQIISAQMAAQAATQNTQSAIQALMGEYTTGLGIEQPLINYGNSAAGQLNYMLGLMPSALPTAPTAPTAPTLASLEGSITPQEQRQYIMENTSLFGGPGNQGLSYQGAGAVSNNPNAQGFVSWPGGPGQNPNMKGGGSLGALYQGVTANPDMTSAMNSEIAQDMMPQAQEQYQTQQDLYNQQLTEYNNALPIAQHYQDLGIATPANITDIVQNLPGYQFQFNQGTQGIQNAASASGMLNSGALLQQLNQFGQGVASNFYNNYLGQLQGLAGLGAGASSQAAQGAQQTGQAAAGAQMNLGDTIANSYLAAGQAAASSYLSPLNSQQNRIVSLGGGGGGGAGSAIGSGIGLLGSMFGGGGGGGGLLGGLF